VLIITTVSGTEIRIPLSDIKTITEIEPTTGNERSLPSHPYIHREGVNRCGACWQPRAHPSHTEQAVRS
jgi:hypothetical protein